VTARADGDGDTDALTEGDTELLGTSAAIVTLNAGSSGMYSVTPVGIVIAAPRGITARPRHPADANFNVGVPL
jgi:hypothetical protein